MTSKLNAETCGDVYIQLPQIETESHTKLIIRGFDYFSTSSSKEKETRLDAYAFEFDCATQTRDQNELERIRTLGHLRISLKYDKFSWVDS